MATTRERTGYCACKPAAIEQELFFLKDPEVLHACSMFSCIYRSPHQNIEERREPFFFFNGRESRKYDQPGCFQLFNNDLGHPRPQMSSETNKQNCSKNGCSQGRFSNHLCSQRVRQGIKCGERPILRGAIVNRSKY